MTKPVQGQQKKTKFCAVQKVEKKNVGPFVHCSFIPSLLLLPLSFLFLLSHPGLVGCPIQLSHGYVGDIHLVFSFVFSTKSNSSPYAMHPGRTKMYRDLKK